MTFQWTPGVKRLKDDMMSTNVFNKKPVTFFAIKRIKYLYCSEFM